MKPDYSNFHLKQTRQLMDVAAGRDTADLVVTNARVFNVFTGEVLDDHNVCVKGEKIASVGPNADEQIGEDTEVIDADGHCLIPGFIDGHAHIAWSFTPEQFLPQIMAGGTTAIVTETFEAYFSAGLDGVLDFLDACRNQPIKVYATAPAMVSISEFSAGIDSKDLETLLEMPEIVGMGESYWQGVLQRPDIYLPAFEKVRARGKTLEGHTAGASEKKLSQYAAAGISSCHEPIGADEALSRLRQGLYVMIREGSIRKDLAAVSEIRKSNVDTRRLVLVTDGVSPDELLDSGYMESVVQKAIDCGFAPADAIRMATLNVAEHFGIDGDIGAVAPGRYADFLLVPELNDIRAACVVSNGRVIARNGRRNADAAARPHRFADASRNSIHLPGPMTAGDFAVSPPDENPVQQVRVIEMVTDLVTRENIMEMPVSEGIIPCDCENDIVKIAAINRRQAPGKSFTGFIKGFGMTCGAMAASGAWDTSDMVVVGAEETDMAAAVNRIYEMQGGITAVKNGKVIAELPLPVFGVISDLAMEEIISRNQALTAAARDLGIAFADPLLTIVTLTGAAIPFLRICEQGLVDLKNGQHLGLFV
ncbi:MAG: adenine deaminase C-terminal domain-containing protein [Thermodesulfobacteriota bacterium]